MVRSLGNSSGEWPFAIKASSHLRCRQIRVPSRRLQLRIGVGMGLDDRTDVRSQLRVLLFAAQPASRGEVLQAAHRLTRLVQSLQDRFSSPPEASFGLTGAAFAEFPGHLGHEQPTLVSSQPSGSRTDQGVEALGGSFHDGSLPWCTRQRQIRPQSRIISQGRGSSIPGRSRPAGRLMLHE